MAMQKVRWGVIGAGGIADRRTIPEGIQCAENSELVAVSDIDSELASYVGAKYEVKSYSHSSEMLEKESLDAVYIAIPTHHHIEWVLAAAEMGVHVLCEKPLAMGSLEANKMVQFCHEHGVKLGVGFMMRFNSYNLKLKELIHSGGLGIPVLGRAQLTCWYPPIEGAWRQIRDQGGGGALLDMGSHCIDLLEFLFGPVVEVCGFVESLVHEYEVEDSSCALLKFANGALGVVDNNFNVPDRSALNTLEVYGSVGSAVARGTIGQDSDGDLRVRTDDSGQGYSAKQERSIGEEASQIRVETRNIYQAQIEEFAESLINDTIPPIPGEDGIHNMKVVEAIYESAMSKKFVTV